ncbi:MAG: energy-coupling factor transporter transmembrane protein EcfT [Corynebacterium sp.]|uniref:energy-coupling factor transporter transmembrane component T family protein n=1 Tax=Corynebacterium TaxID=1716 RepID=UPI002648C8D8|nr:energy-coupling factor transporter transmembrane protein EcfT [Corynebacterium sp.]MDN5721934.1 energy-coupling factor transporter transmembrane protein EcfT [Corynebacterium sp.]MDN6283277.1 energy-coupling factor transporter transmembrane protein EcfT [Corynebacterium sp.]MDN6306646.1 energy-coupling factor transporter transmembrane protein EcfT [Corynebacterium sp.]MDN6352626.1 energy-coupling factor transporter transmembrane protein EcfT [Corynebacterium sp.]MDN6368661.1 energy-coupling
MISTSRVPLGVYSPGNTVVHRAPAGIKLLVLTVFILSTAIFVSTWQWAAVSVGMVVLTAAVARIPARLFVRQLSGALPLLIFIALMLWWRTDGEQALTMFLVLLSAIAAAILLTLTTRVSVLMETFERILAPTARIGVPVDQVALAMTLTIRLIPLQVQAVNEVLDARRARGSRSTSASLTAFGVPIVVRTILRSRAIADALRARGAAD